MCPIIVSRLYQIVWQYFGFDVLSRPHNHPLNKHLQLLQRQTSNHRTNWNYPRVKSFVHLRLPVRLFPFLCFIYEYIVSSSAYSRQCFFLVRRFPVSRLIRVPAWVACQVWNGFEPSFACQALGKFRIYGGPSASGGFFHAVPLVSGTNVWPTYLHVHCVREGGGRETTMKREREKNDYMMCRRLQSKCLYEKEAYDIHACTHTYIHNIHTTPCTILNK